MDRLTRVLAATQFQGDPFQRRLATRGATMSIHNNHDDHDNEEQRDENQVNEDGPGVNGDLGSWFYVLGGIPSMIIFFVVLFGVVGSCDGQNVMLNG